MDIHYDTSFKSILEVDSISSTPRAYIRSWSSKGARLWSISRPFIYSFCIGHSTFTLALRFRLSLIQPSASSFFMCECGHGLDAFGTHLTCCLFRGQWITTHDIIRNIMYAFIWKSGRNVWRKWWYAFMSKVSLWVNFYMTLVDHVFVANVVVINMRNNGYECH
jgi:hypothetical protein